MDEKQRWDILTKPTPGLIEAVRNLKGDVMILGAGGKMGPSLAILLQRVIHENNLSIKVIGVSRFSDQNIQDQLIENNIEILAGDLLDDQFLTRLPKVKNIIYMVGQKFGTYGNQGQTWAMNAYLPGRVASTFSRANIVVFSTGNIYPFVPIDGNGADESTHPDPVGEYAQSCLGRERIFEYFCKKNRTPILIYRLNYALDLTYGVLNDLARMVFEEKPIDLSMGYVNMIWQGDANNYAIRCLHHCTVPASFLNITGTEILSVKLLANRFGELFSKKPVFTGTSSPSALLNNARKAHRLFGKPSISSEQMIQWTAEWIQSGGASINKPTHFQERKGKF